MDEFEFEEEIHHRHRRRRCCRQPLDSHHVNNNSNRSNSKNCHNNHDEEDEVPIVNNDNISECSRGSRSTSHNSSRISKQNGMSNGTSTTTSIRGRSRKRRLATFTSKVGRGSMRGNMNKSAAAITDSSTHMYEVDDENVFVDEEDTESKLFATAKQSKKEASSAIKRENGARSNKMTVSSSSSFSSSTSSSIESKRSHPSVSSSTKTNSSSSLLTTSRRSRISSSMNSSQSTPKRTNHHKMPTLPKITEATLQTPPAPPTPQTPPSYEWNGSSSSGSIVVPQLKYHHGVKDQKQFLHQSHKDDSNINDTNSRSRRKHDENEEGSDDTMNSNQESPPYYHEESQKITGAGTDVFGIQDAGSFRFVQDDCAYLCSSFLSSVNHNKNCNSNKSLAQHNHYQPQPQQQHLQQSAISIPNIKHNSATADTICDLVIMISSKKTRDALMNIGSGVENEFRQESCITAVDCVYDNKDDKDNDRSKTDTIQSILDVLSYVPTSVKGHANLATLAFLSSSPSSSPCDRKMNNKMIGYDQVIAEAQSLLAHFLSFDCTLNAKYSASSTLDAARSFRKIVLQHKGAMQGIARLLLADSVVSDIISFRKMDKSETNINVKTDTSLSKDLNKDATDPLDGMLSQESWDLVASSKPKKKKRRLNFGSSCAAINDESQQFKEKHFGDPTKAGRRKKNRRMKASSSNNDVQSTTTYCPNVTKYNSKLEKATKYIALSDKLKRDDGQLNVSSRNPGFLALDALNRIIHGRFDDDEEEDNENGTVCGEEDENADVDDMECDELEKDNLKNPLIFRNVLIRRSGALPFLSRAMTEALEAALLLFQSNNESSELILDVDGRKESYKEYLRDRINFLSSVLDTVCCLSSENRRSLCATGFAVDGEGIESSVLIASLLRTISSLPIAPCSGNTNHFFADIALASYRTLTSLTHENDIAAQQLVTRYNIEVEALIPIQEHTSGVEVLAKTLFTLVKVQQKIRDNKSKLLKAFQQHVYDAIVFSLNTLTNVLETSSSNEARKLISKLQVGESTEGDNNLVLSWLARWVVNQTSTFQDAVITNPEPLQNDLSQNLNSQRDLEHHEDEFLVQAGNGFILLTCFLLGDNEYKNENLDKQIHEDIMNEMPKNANGTSMGITLIVNTLKAFCNYYKFSIGELSVAVVDPVRKLISKLEETKY